MEHFEVGGDEKCHVMETAELACRQVDNYLQSITPELSNETRFFTFRPLYDPVEPFDVDL